VAYRDTLAARDALYAIAARQGGYVTTSQARDAGYGDSHLTYHRGTGQLERVGHGLYRVPSVPLHEHDELIRLALWSRDRSGRPQAVVSHDTALALHGISDVLPVATHLTVPPKFRKPRPPGCVLHVARVPTDDLRSWTVFSVTTPARTLADASSSRTMTAELLGQAVAQALREGLVTAKELRRRCVADGRGRLAVALQAATSPGRSK
jgi:predicted transcriptional regulator of viral defense system